jgi:hypothetical protein
MREFLIGMVAGGLVLAVISLALEILHGKGGQ